MCALLLYSLLLVLLCLVFFVDFYFGAVCTQLNVFTFVCFVYVQCEFSFEQWNDEQACVRGWSRKRVREKQKVVEMQWVHDFYWSRFILIHFVSCNMLRVADFFSLTFYLCCFFLLFVADWRKIHRNSYTQWYRRRRRRCVRVRTLARVCNIFFICSSQQILLENRHRGKDKMRLLRSTIRKSKQWKASLLHWSQFAGRVVVCACGFF